MFFSGLDKVCTDTHYYALPQIIVTNRKDKIALTVQKTTINRK